MAEAGDAFLGPAQQNILQNEVMFALLSPLELLHEAWQCVPVCLQVDIERRA